VGHWQREPADKYGEGQRVSPPSQVLPEASLGPLPVEVVGLACRV
jgi:hypothetical protein